MPDSVVWRGLEVLLRGVKATHHAALATSSCIRMNDALRGGLVDALYSKTKIGFTFGCADIGKCITYASTKFALDSLVTVGCFCVSKNALLLTLDVCHGEQCYRATGPSPTA